MIPANRTVPHCPSRVPTAVFPPASRAQEVRPHCHCGAIARWSCLRPSVLLCAAPDSSPFLQAPDARTTECAVREFSPAHRTPTGARAEWTPRLTHSVDSTKGVIQRAYLQIPVPACYEQSGEHHEPSAPVMTAKARNTSAMTPVAATDVPEPALPRGLCGSGGLG